MNNNTIKLKLGFEVNELRIWNPYQQIFFNKYAYSLNGLYLGTTGCFYNSNNKFNQWIKDIQDGFIKLQDSCDLAVLEYK